MSVQNQPSGAESKALVRLLGWPAENTGRIEAWTVILGAGTHVHPVQSSFLHPYLSSLHEFNTRRMSDYVDQPLNPKPLGILDFLSSFLNRHCILHTVPFRSRHKILVHLMIEQRQML